MKSYGIINLWFERKIKRNQDNYDKSFNQILSEDEFCSQVRNLVNALNEILTRNGYDKIAVNLQRYTDNKTDGKIVFLEEELAKKNNAIYDLYTEIKNILAACETYEQEMEVLKNYGIIGDDGKMIS